MKLVAIVTVSALVVSLVTENSSHGSSKTAILEEIQPSREKKDAAAKFPANLEFKLHVENKSIGMRLRRNNMDNENADIYVIATGNDGNAKVVKQDVQKDEEIGLYQDVENGGAFTVRCDKLDKRTCRRSLLGTLYLDGLPYNLKKHDDKTRDESQTVEGQRYLLTERGDIPENSEVDLDTESETQDWDTVKTASIWRRQGKSANYGVELLVFTDYQIYKDFYDMNTVMPNYYRKEETLRKLRQHFAGIVNGVDLRYSNIRAKDFSIYVRVAGYVVADTPDKSRFTSNKVEQRTWWSKERDVIDAKNALRDFKHWMADTKGLPEIDHGMCFTGYDIADQGNKKTLGIAYMSSVCKRDKASLIEYHGDMMATIETASHELGHNLGSNHDGDKNNCGSNKQNIMASFAGTRHDSIKLNPWKFSSCSVQYFRGFLGNLDRNAENCLENTAQHANRVEYALHSMQLPGQIYSSTEQCRFLKGKASYFCKGIVNSEDLCTKLYCHMPQRPGMCQEFLAARGTSCANKKWCIDGKCTFDSRAPDFSPWK